MRMRMASADTLYLLHPDGWKGKPALNPCTTTERLLLRAVHSAKISQRGRISL